MAERYSGRNRRNDYDGNDRYYERRAQDGGIRRRAAADDRPMRVRVTAKNFLRIGETKVRLGAFDYQFLLITLILVAFGLVMLYSASSSRAYAAQDGDSMYFVKRQIFFGLGLGVPLMIAFMSIDYHFLAKFSGLFYGVGIFLLILVLVPGVGTTAGGATRWIFGFQPSEFMKFATIIMVAWYLDTYKEYIGKFGKGFLPCLAILAVVAFLLMLEPHFSATILIVFTGMLMMFAAGAKISHFAVLSVPAILGGIALVIKSPYRLQRIVAFADPFADKQGSGWQIVQSLYAMGSGGVFGVGFGQSRQKYMSLPEPHNDFIFSVLAEELGWVGVIIVIALFVCLVVRGIKIAQKAPDKLGMLIVVGCIGLIGVQALINIGVVSASFPVTGMPLPFFSYGGSALAVTLAEIGMILNVSRQERVL